jgi:hypothetical protein
MKSLDFLILQTDTDSHMPYNKDPAISLKKKSPDLPSGLLCGQVMPVISLFSL